MGVISYGFKLVPNAQTLGFRTAAVSAASVRTAAVSAAGSLSRRQILYTYLSRRKPAVKPATSGLFQT